MKKSIAGLFIFSLLILLLGDMPWADVWVGAKARLFGDSIEWNPLLDERLPRLIVVLTTGASLAVSGAVMQALFQNPLASPSVLGISLGGSLSVFFVFLLGGHLAFPFALPLAAFLGCMATLFLVWAMTRRYRHDEAFYLILAGLALATFLMAVQGALVYLFRQKWSLIQLWMEWEAGSTLDRSWAHVNQQMPLAIVGLLGCWKYRQELNLLSLGDEEASHLGVEVKQVRWNLFFFVALLTAGSLAACGVIPFFGLVLPHIVRLLWGADNRFLIPQCLVLGAFIMVGMEVILRSFSIEMLSMGQLSALCGGFFFLIMVLQPSLFFTRAAHVRS